jgi:hypothetical protein
VDDATEVYCLLRGQVFAKCRLERLLDCDKPSTIIIEHSGCFRQAAEEAAKNLGKLLEEKFASKKQVVEVQYTRKSRRPCYSSYD